MSCMQVSIRAALKLSCTIVLLLGGVAIYAAPARAAASGKYGGSARFTCIPTTVIECVGEGECRPGTAESENLPDFFKVNLQDHTIGTDDKQRLSQIKRIDRTTNDISLYGTEAGRAWVLMIQENTGRMSASVIGNGESFMVFGVCPPP
jgi:hypothetical protein